MTQQFVSSDHYSRLRAGALNKNAEPHAPVCHGTSHLSKGALPASIGLRRPADAVSRRSPIGSAFNVRTSWDTPTSTMRPFVEHDGQISLVTRSDEFL